MAAVGHGPNNADQHTENRRLGNRLIFLKIQKNITGQQQAGHIPGAAVRGAVLNLNRQNRPAAESILRRVGNIPAVFRLAEQTESIHPLLLPRINMPRGPLPGEGVQLRRAARSGRAAVPVSPMTDRMLRPASVIGAKSRNLIK
jgi:hypothetical protein